MKYNSSNPPIICMQTNSTCYKGTSTMQIKGVLWHSTGANNPNIKRYVQPSENDPKYSELMELLGKNTAKNDWNHIYGSAGLNAWVGKLADGTVASVQTMPWNFKPWGCGGGAYGSCNSGWIQFEICEDGLNDSTYFNKVYNEACELTAYLCKAYNLDPLGTTKYGNITVPVILCHYDSYKCGLGSGHIDVYHWFDKYGKTMNNVREDVARLMGTSGPITIPDYKPTSVSTSKTYLSKGDSGTAVKELQEKLNKLGYNCGVADGIFGSATEGAVIQFQKANGLSADGLAGTQTMAKLDACIKALNEKQPSTPTVTASTPSTSTSSLYRIRTEWTKPGSQIGAYKSLDGAKLACDAAGPAYHVFDDNGTIVYPVSSSSQAPVKYSGVVIGAASKDENGQYVGGQPGDQTGAEVKTLSWYDGGWDVVLRPKDNSLAEKIAQQCEAGCANSAIGYNQNNRNSIYSQALKSGLNLSKITTMCDCDCSSFVSACCICAGLPASVFYPGNNLCNTRNLQQACESTGKFTVLKDSKYLRQKDYLKRGDIVLNTQSHAAICVGGGDKANEQPVQTSFIIQVTANVLNVRSLPDDNSKVVTTIQKNYKFTIVEVNGKWGKLKSGAGWIDLTYTKRV